MKAIYWLRSDLRTHQNEALNEFLSRGEDEIIFVLPETKSFKRAGLFRKKIINECFENFKNDINFLKCQIIQTSELFSEFLSSYCKDQQLTSVYFTREYAWEERQEELLVEKICGENGIKTYSYDQGTLIAQDDLPFSIENMPFIFTDFRKAVESDLKVRKTVCGPLKEKCNKGLERLFFYLWESRAIDSYKETRNGMIHFNDSTKLSPWINSGVLSVRMIYHELKKYEEKYGANESTYWLVFELLWRDYMKFFSLKYGHQIFLKQGLRKGNSPNQDDLDKFELWSKGKTENAFINANMNELNQTGWMSNRGRQNVASYLVHDLGVNWTWGASYFEEKLIDYDPDLNWGNWLYLSGRGSDPRARKFNPLTQAKTYDPEGYYQKMWNTLPE
jgi:deoxyribodipyrimidine photo-lyase